MEKEHLLSLEDAIQKIYKTNTEENVLQCFKILDKLLTNILNKPMEDKFRNINKANKAIQAKVFQIPDIEATLKLFGYVQKDINILTMEKVNLAYLTQVSAKLNEVMENITDKSLTPQELEKKNNEKKRLIELAEAEKQKKGELAYYQDRMKLDRAEKEKEEKPEEAKATDLRFGATVKKFEPPAGG